MFDREATRLTRIDWMKYGLSALNPSSGQEPTNEQLRQAIVGMATGFNQFAQELSQLLGGHDIPVKHRAPAALIGYEPDAPGVNDDTEIEDTYPRLIAWSGDSYYDPADGYAKGGLAGLFQGVVLMRPNVNNVNVNIGNAQHKIVLWGQNGAGIKFENIYVENLYDPDGNPYALSAMPVGSVMLWAGSIGSIPSGWALMDGTANSTGSGIDMRGQVPYGYSGAGDFSTIGGTIALALESSIAGSGATITTSTDGVHGHNVSGAEISGAISISAHSGSSTANTGSSSPALTPSPILEDLAFGADVAVYIWTSGTGSPSVASHSHTISGSDVASLLGNHTISTTGGTAETDNVGDHSHTFSVNTVASNLIIGVPTVVRPEGKVLAFIEKIA